MSSFPLPPDRSYVPPEWTHHLEFDALVRSITDYAIFLLDKDGRVLTWNAGARRFKGYTEEEIVGHSYTLFYPPADVLAGKPQRLLETAIREGRVEDEGWRIRKDGRSFWADVVITAIRDDDGELLGFCKVTRDLTERREAEQRRASLAAVFDNLPGGIAILDRELTFQAVNPTYAAAFGLRPDEFNGRHVFNVFPGTEDQVGPMLRGVLATGKPHSAFGFRFVTPEGSETHWDFTYAPVRDERGAVAGVMALCFEVTPRIRLEREMAEARALNERIIDHAPAGIAFLDHDLVFRRVNDVYARLLGLEVSTMVDRSIHEVFGDAAGQVETLMSQVQRTGEPYTASNFPFFYQVAGEERRTYWDFTYQPVSDRNGRTGVLILCAEVSDRRESERLQAEQIAQLREVDRLKDEFLSVISHELRTPLNFITGFASTLEDELQGPLNEDQHKAVSKILSGADRMLMLVDDLLDFAKMQSGHLEMEFVTTPYEPLVGEVLGLLLPLADRKGLAIEARVPADLAPTIDGQRVAQVLTNLVTNAIKFTERGGRIEVTAAERAGELVTEVRDTGVGIAPEHRDKLFKRFQQIDMSNTRRVGGTGLGLAISKAIVEAHGGTIGVESVPGEGSTFWFRLPFRPAAQP